MKNQEIWNILGISPTEDKNEIKKAYRSRLSQVNPEDDPEGFMNLREAYEKALSDEEDTAEGEEQEEEVQESLAFLEMKERLAALYKDFDRRISPEEWNSLLEDPYFVSLETGEEAFRCLMEFLMDHIRVPHHVVKLLLEHFEIPARRKELTEWLPEKFVDYLIQNGTYPDRIDYCIFDVAAEDVDDYIETYYHMTYNGEEDREEEEEKALEHLDSLQSRHPFRDVYVLNRRLRFLLRDWEEKTEDMDAEPFGEVCKEELRKMQEEMDQILARFPEQQDILRSSATLARRRRDFSLAEERTETLIRLDPESIMNRMQKGILLLEEDQFKEASELFMEVLQTDRSYEPAYRGMQSANEGQIKEFRRLIEEEPDNDERKLDLGWCLFQNDRYEEAIRITKEVAPEGENRYPYYNLMGRLYLYTDQPRLALSHMEKWEEEILKISPEAMDEESVTRRKRISLCRYLQADALRRLQEYDAARELLDKALEGNQMPGLEVDIQEQRIRVDYEDRKFPDCYKETEQLLREDSYNQTALLFQAKCLYQYDQNQEAYNLLNRLLEINPYEVDGWMVKLWILMEVDQEEDGLSLIAHCEELGIRSEKICILKGEIGSHLRRYELAKEAYSEALQLANDKHERGRAYLGLAAALGCLKEFDEAKKLYGEIFREKGWDPAYMTDYGELLVRMGDLEGAKEFLLQRIKDRKEEKGGEGDDWETQFMRMNLCCFCGNEGDVETAYRLFRESIEAHPEDLNAYRCMAEVLLEHDRAAEAVKLLETGMKATEKDPSSHLGLYLMAVREANGDLSLAGDAVEKARAYFEDESRRVEDRDRELVRKTEYYFAVEEYERALELVDERLGLKHSYYNCFAEVHGAYYMQGMILSAMGEHEKAAASFRKALEIFGHQPLYRECLEKEETLLKEERKG